MHCKQKCKSCFFKHIFAKTVSIYVKLWQKWPPAHSAYIVKYISSVEILHFCDSLWLYGRVACCSGHLAVQLLAYKVTNMHNFINKHYNLMFYRHDCNSMLFANKQCVILALEKTNAKHFRNSKKTSFTYDWIHYMMILTAVSYYYGSHNLTYHIQMTITLKNENSPATIRDQFA